MPMSQYTEFCTVSVHKRSEDKYIFWSVMPCSLAGIYQRFRRTFRLHIRGLRWRQDVRLKSRYIYTKLHGVTLQNTVYLHSQFHDNLKSHTVGIIPPLCPESSGFESLDGDQLSRRSFRRFTQSPPYVFWNRLDQAKIASFHVLFN
jgi:hypothetical protein